MVVAEHAAGEPVLGGQLYSRFPEGRQIDVIENISLQENLTLVASTH